MANIIKIKRSSTSAAPLALEWGEMAIGNTGVVYIGTEAGGVERIAGFDGATEQFAIDQAVAKAAAALQDAKDYTDAEIGSLGQTFGDQLDALIGDATVDGTAGNTITDRFQAYADQAEVDAKAYADQKIADLVNGAPEALDTLLELSQAITTNENGVTDLVTLAGNLSSELNNTQAALGLAENGDYVSPGVYDADANPAGAHYIAAATTMMGAVSQLDASLYAEEVARTNAITSLQNQINTNAGTASNDLSDLQTLVENALNDEITDRQDGDTALQNAIDTIEASVGLGLDGSFAITGNYVANAATLKAAVVALDAQAKTNADAIATNAQAIADEVTARTNADTALSDRIDALETDAGDKNAAEISYTVADANNWEVVPTNVKQGLDYLAGGLVGAYDEVALVDQRVSDLVATQIGFDNTNTQLTSPGGTVDTVQEAIEAVASSAQAGADGLQAIIDNLDSTDIFHKQADAAGAYRYAWTGETLTTTSVVDHSVYDSMESLHAGINKVFAEINSAASNGSTVLADMATQRADNVNILGGGIDNVAITNSTMDGGTF